MVYGYAETKINENRQQTEQKESGLEGFLYNEPGNTLGVLLGSPGWD